MLGKSKKLIFNSIIQQYYLRYLRRKQTVTQLPTTPEKVTTQTCEMQNFLNLTEGLLRSFKYWRLWKEPVLACGNWDIRHATSQQVFKVTTFSMDTCFQSFFANDQLHHTPRSAEIQPMSQQAAAATHPYLGLVLDTRAPAVACPIRGNRAMQIIGSTKQQSVNS